MSNRHRQTLAAFGVAIALAMSPLAAQASRALGKITGVVTAPTTSDRIVVDGRAYHILPGSPAVAERNNVRVGQTVDLTLAPAGKNPAVAGSVMGIAVHPATGVN